MSTKTSIKRVALVAVAALTIGGFSAVSAHATAATGVSGLAFSAKKDFSAATASTTPGTIANPIQLTMVANSVAYLDVVETGTAVAPVGYFGTLSTFADTGSVTSLLTSSTGTPIGTTDSVTTITAPSTTGTYYGEISAGSIAAGNTYGYVVITVVNVLATTYDGTVAGIGSATVNGVAGSSNTVTLTVVTHGSTGKAGFINVSGSGATIAALQGTTYTTAPTQGKIVTGSEGDTTVVINTPTAGSVTVTYAPETAAGSGIAGAVTDTINITVNTSGSSGVLSATNSTLYDTTTINAAAATASLTAATGVATASATTPVAEYTYTLLDALKAAYNTSSTTKATIVVSGPGLVSSSGSNSQGAAKSVSFSDATNTHNFWLYGDGTSGVTTLTLSVGSTVVATKTLTFYSTTVASLAATVNHGIVNKAAVTGFAQDTGTAGTVSYVSVVAKDASGNAIPSLTNLVASSSSTSVLTVGTPSWDATDLVYYVPVSGVASGSAVVTIKDVSGLVSTTASLKVAKAQITTLTAAFDNSSYNAGDLGHLVLTATDADGNPVADGYYTNALGGAFLTSQALTSTLFGTTLHFVNGVATASFYAPYAPGTLSVTANGGSSTTVLGTALQALAGVTAVSATTTITGGADSSAATDAANAATDAANAAADAADNATQAASEALAAVNSLATTVASLIAGIKAQITSLTNLITKIKNKVGA